MRNSQSERDDAPNTGVYGPNDLREIRDLMRINGSISSHSYVHVAIVIDSEQNLKDNPADQMVYYLQQNVAILAQISQQVFSLSSSSYPFHTDTDLTLLSALRHLAFESISFGLCFSSSVFL
jgi:hypothetical protein